LNGTELDSEEKRKAKLQF